MVAASHMHPASYLLTVDSVNQLRHFLAANGLGMCTARVKAAARGRIDGIGRVTSQGPTPAVPLQDLLARQEQE